MTRRVRRVVVAGTAVAATVGLAVGALALWRSTDSAVAAPVRVGAVSFGADDAWSTTGPRYSADGGPVTLTLPGSEVAKALDGPVTWKLTVDGYAEGITGMTYDVTAGHQVGPDGQTTDLGSGAARPGTVLEHSTTVVYPASADGECAVVPDVPDQGKNVYVVDGAGHTLQAPGAYEGAPVQQTWCVAMTAAPDSTYANRADVAGTAADGTVVRGSDLFEAVVRPDPSAEPDVTITLDPTVTNLNPSVPAGDHFTPSAPITTP